MLITDNFNEDQKREKFMAKYTPDYKYMAKMDSFKLEEFCLLINGINPELYRNILGDIFGLFSHRPSGISGRDEPYFENAFKEAERCYNLLNRVPWNKKYENCYNIADNTILTAALIPEVIEKGLFVPDEYLENYYASRNKKKTETKDDQSDEENNTSQKSRARNTLLKVIAAMARSGYGKKDLLMPVGFSQELERDTQINGYPVSDATLLEILKEASSYMCNPEDDS